MGQPIYMERTIVKEVQAPMLWAAEARDSAPHGAAVQQSHPAGDRSPLLPLRWQVCAVAVSLITAALISAALGWRAVVVTSDLSWWIVPDDADRLREHLQGLQQLYMVGLALTALLVVGGILLTMSLGSRARRTIDQLQRDLRQSETRYRAMADLATDYAYAIAIKIDGELEIEWATEAFTRITGARPEHLNSRAQVMSLIHPDDRARMTDRWKTLSNGHPDVSEFRILTLHGSVRTVRDYSRPVWDDRERRVVRVYGAAQDITDDKALEGQLVRKAFSDPLTGLANRALFMERLHLAVQRSGREDSGLAVLFIDLDRFKIVNDSLGHAAGDTLLVGVAARLNACVRQDDLVARLGGDEFTVLIDQLGDSAQAERVAERILAELRLPFALANRDVSIGASIGIALRLHGTPSRDAEALLREADTALYRAKSSGKGCAVTFDGRLAAGVSDRLEVEAELRSGIEDGQLVAYYQPEVDLETGSIVGMEALVRWQHPRRGLLLPREIIPLAEECGLIGAIDLWVLDEACRQVQSWRERSPALQLMISVNLSGSQFRNPGLTERIARTLAATGLEPSSLRIEITETVLMEDGVSALSTLRELRDLGIRLAIDDFGTGYSSLSYLQRFPVDTIKLDRSFVTGIVRDETTQAIVRAVTSLGEGLHLQVTVEGIETAEQWAQVYGAGCRYAQGYYFAPPLPAEQMEELLSGGTGRFRPSREIERRARHRAETRWHDRRALLTDEVLRLPEEFEGIFSSETVERFTRVALESLEGSRVQAYLSTLVGRATRESLRALAITDRIPSGQRATILFVCVTGAGASPMAAALAQQLSDGWIRARAVGSGPAEAVDPIVVRAMSEIGIELPRETPWPLTEQDVLSTDVIVTLGCGDVCPLLPEKRYRDWDIAAPDGLAIERVREIRETLHTHVRHLLAELGLARAA